MRDSPLSRRRYHHLEYNGRCRRRRPSHPAPRQSRGGKWDVSPREQSGLMECSSADVGVGGGGFRACLAGCKSHLRLCVLDWDSALLPGEGRSQAIPFSSPTRCVKATSAGGHPYPQHPDLITPPALHQALKGGADRWRQSKTEIQRERKSHFCPLFSPVLFPVSPLWWFAVSH